MSSYQTAHVNCNIHKIYMELEFSSSENNIQDQIKMPSFEVLIEEIIVKIEIIVKVRYILSKRQCSDWKLGFTM